ncbi:MAG: aminofutalosine synthase MqnE, partial [Candidatus Methylomirabilales bacterium]
LDSIPGGGAEIFSERVHQELFPLKLGAEGWLRIAKAAHRVGLRSNATMLYGHIETVEEKVDHLIRLREAQDETGGFLCYIPLAFDPKETELDHLPGTTGEADLREIAVARLLLDNFDHIKAFWIMSTPQVSQISLWYGADDIDGTVVEYEITHALGISSNQQALSEKQLVEMILEAGREPVERDALYNPVS